MALTDQQFIVELQQSAGLIADAVSTIGDLENRSISMTDFIERTRKLRDLAAQLTEIQMEIQGNQPPHVHAEATGTQAPPPPTTHHRLFGG